MDEYDAAEVIAFELNKSESWTAAAELNDVLWTNEDGVKFRLTVELDETGD